MSVKIFGACGVLYDISVRIINVLAPQANFFCGFVVASGAEIAFPIAKSIENSADNVFCSPAAPINHPLFL